MVNLEMFLLGLLITSTLTSLVTEAIKKLLAERDINYYSNTLVGVVALVLSVAIGVGYCVVAGIDFTSKIVVCLVAQVFMSWLCAMVGYDKVIQAVAQFKNSSETK